MMNNLDVKGIVAILIVVGAFVLIGTYVFQGKTPDANVIEFTAPALALVLGFYFGHANGTATAALNASTLQLQLAGKMLAQAQQRRTGDPPVVQTPVIAVPGS